MPGPYLNVGAWQTSVTANDAAQKEELGVWRFEGAKIYRYVRAGAGGVIPAGESVRLDHTALLSGASPGLMGAQVVQVDSSTAMFFGVAESTLSAASYGWVTIYGPATARVVSLVIPGTAIGPSTAAGLTGVLAVRDISHFNAVGLAVQTGLSAGSAVFINIL